MMMQKGFWILSMKEFEFISYLEKSIVNKNKYIGDDAALIYDRLLISKDILSENVHFLSSTPLKYVIHKLFTCNISDISSMGAVAKYVLLGLALKDNLSNLAAGIIILVFKAYKVGDEVNINEEVGFIYEIDVFSTSIRTYNGDLIIVPNGVIISDKIINYTKIPIRRLKFVIRVSYDCNLKIARESLEKLLRDNPLVIDDPPIVSHVESYEEGFIVFCK